MNYYLGYNQGIDLTNIYILSAASITGFISFHLAYSYNKKIESSIISLKTRANDYNISLLQKILTLLLLIAILIEIYFFMQNGISSYFLVTRSDRTLIVNDSGFSTIFSELFFLVYILSLVFMSVKKTKTLKILFIVSLVNLIIYQLLIIDRSGFLKIVLPLMFFLILDKKIKNKTMVLVSLCLFVFLSYFKSIMSSLIFKVDIPLEKFRFNSEFEVWYGIGSTILDGLKTNSISYLYGESYLNAAYNLVIPFNSTEPLSIWYVKNFYPEIYLKGGGMAFSSITEAILNLGIIFVPVHFMMLGFLCRYIDSKKFNNLFYLSMYAFLFTVMYKFFRSEVYSLVKTSWWFYVLPILFIFIVISQKKVEVRKKNEKNFIYSSKVSYKSDSDSQSSKKREV